MLKYIYKFILLILLTIPSFSKNIEENGVKNGNIQLSAGLFTEQGKKDSANTINLDIKSGYFLSNNIEIILGLKTITKNKETTFTLSPGFNYYFYQTPIFTPYIGFQYYYQNTTNEYISSKEGDSFYMGTHLFLSEDIALTPEFGVNYLDFKEKQNTYFNTSLSYFF